MNKNILTSIFFHSLLHLTFIFHFFSHLPRHYPYVRTVQLEPLIVQAYNDSLAQAQHTESHENNKHHTHHTHHAPHTQDTHNTHNTHNVHNTQDGEQERGRSREHSSATSSLPSHINRPRPRSLSQTPRERTSIDSTDIPLKYSSKEPDLHIPQPLIRSTSSVSDSPGKRKRIIENFMTVENTEKSKVNNYNIGTKYHHRHAHRTHGHHSQTNCLFFVDPCTSLELMSPSSDDPAQGIPVQVPQAVIPSKL